MISLIQNFYHNKTYPSPITAYVLTIFFLLPILYFLSLPFTTDDLGIWISLGNQILETKSLSPPEVFALDHVNNTIYPSWGISIVYALIYNLAPGLWGLKFIYLFHKLLLIFLLLFIYKKHVHQFKTNWSPSDSLIILLSSYSISYMFAERPAFVAFIPFILFAHFIEKEETSTSFKNHFILFLICILWANIHASILIAPFLIIYRILAKCTVSVFKKTPFHFSNDFYQLCTTLVAIHITPFHYHIWSYMVSTAYISSKRFIGEWSSPFSMTAPANSLGFFVLLIFSMWIFFRYIIKRKHLPLITSLFWPSLVLGLTSNRHTIWASLLLIPFWKQVRNPTTKYAEQSSYFLSYAGFIICITLILLINPVKRPNFISNLNIGNYRYNIEEQTGMNALDFIRSQNYTGPVFCQIQDAGIIETVLKNQILLDSRNIIFDDTTISNYIKIIRGQKEGEQTLRSYNFKMALIRNEEKSLVQVFEKNYRWENLYRGKVYSVFKYPTSPH